MSNIKFRFAYNQNGEIVNIKDVSLQNRTENKYYCISCGAEMVAKLGEVKEHHFAHKGEGESCSFESYLHKLAKKMIKEKFDASNTFEIEVFQNVLCVNSDICKFFSVEECKGIELKKFDLKRYYNSCQEEAQIGNYRADLLLADDTGKYKEPILIEIKVLHECSQDKINSGFRIIEIPINTEDDIMHLTRSCINYKSVNLYNFKFKSIKKELSRHVFWRYTLYKNGLSHIDRWIPCSTSRKNTTANLELNIKFNYSRRFNCYEYGMAYAISKGYLIRNCSLCQYKKDRINSDGDTVFCCLYRKYGTPKYPYRTHATECSYYLLDKNRVNTIIADLPNVIIEEVK